MKYIAFTLLMCTLGSAVASAATPDDSSATLICRPTTTTERANATLKDASTELICRPFSIAMKMSDGSLHVIGSTSVSNAQPGPDLSHALSSAQINDSWVHYLETTFHIDHTN